jgi:hypothetical protein
LKPTKGQKRKHNLMYLAYQAAAMENDLKEQFAVNKKTKRETQAKYGIFIIFIITINLSFMYLISLFYRILIIWLSGA